MYVTLLKDYKTMDAPVPDERPDPLDNYLRLWGLEAYIASFKGKLFLYKIQLAYFFVSMVTFVAEPGSMEYTGFRVKATAWQT